MLFRLVLLLSVFGLVSPAAHAGLFSKSSRGKSIDEQYDECIRSAERGYFTKALEVCNRVRNVYRDSPLSTLAEIAIADIYFKRGDYEQARIAYEDFSRMHPRHERLDYIIFRIGLTIYKRSPSAPGRDQAATKQAVNAWTGFDKRFPESEHNAEVSKLLGKARNRLAKKEFNIAKFYARKNAWKATQNRLEGLLRRYSDTAIAPEAYAVLGEAYHNWGMTHKAKSIRDRLAESFPESKHIGHLDKVLSGPPGDRPEEPTFVRPYRMPGGMGQMGGR